MASHTPFIDLALSRRLEHAEAASGVSFIEARMALEPEHGATWVNRHGAHAMFDGADSPVTQTFGLGLEQTPTVEDLDTLEAFFFDRHADVSHEVSPLAGVSVFSTLATRGYTPIELTSVMFRAITNESAAPSASEHSRLRVRQITSAEAEMFGATAAKGWSDTPGLGPFLERFGRVMASRIDGPCFVAELDGHAVAAGALTLSKGVGMLAGASTIPEFRRRGAQLALLDARLRCAASVGCDLAMMCAAPGSASQRNAERNGLRIAYTRVKWQMKENARR